MTPAEIEKLMADHNAKLVVGVKALRDAAPDLARLALNQATEIALLRVALRNSVALLQVACRSKRINEGDSYGDGSLYAAERLMNFARKHYNIAEEKL